jgi:hypothetical protein
VVEGGEEHCGEVEKGLRVQPVVQRQQDGRQEEQVAQGQQQGVAANNWVSQQQQAVSTTAGCLNNSSVYHSNRVCQQQ